jgi:biopolymer transport protein ExbB
MKVKASRDGLGELTLLRLLCVFAAVAAMSSRVRAGAVGLVERLKVATQQTESELAAEKARIEKEEEARQSELEEFKAECQKLADELVERRVSIARKQTDLRTLRRQREKLWTQRTQWQEDRSQMKVLCAEIEKDLSELLNVVPVSEGRASQLEGLARIRKALAEDKIDSMIESSLAVITSLLGEIRSTAVYPAEMLDSRGALRQALLVRAGYNVFAYHIPGTSEAAVAISDPYAEGGYRWYEGIKGDMREAVINAINEAPDRPGLYRLPVDVTGTMTATTDLADKTLAGRFRSGGVVMFPLAVVAICLAMLVLERLLVLLPETSRGLRFCERALEMCGRGEFKQAGELAERTNGILSRTLKVCLSHRKSSPQVLDDVIQETFLHEFPKLERFLPSIRMLSAVAPILGLLGTVTGIIATFDMITVVGGGKPRLLAGGISEALITTAAGLIIAIPGLLAHSFLSGRINSIIAEAERFAASLSNLIKNQKAAGYGKEKGGNKDDAAD